jgi:hypothetical protein
MLFNVPQNIIRKKKCILYDSALGGQLLDLWSLGLPEIDCPIQTSYRSRHLLLLCSSSRKRLQGFFFSVALRLDAGHGLLNS